MPGENLCAVGLFQAALLILLVGLLCKRRERARERLLTVWHSFMRPWQTTGQILILSSSKPTFLPSKVLLKHFMRLSLWREALQASPPPSCITFLFKHPVSVSQKWKGRCKLVACYCWFLSECPSTCVAGWFQVFALWSPQFSGACSSWSEWMGLLLYSPLVFAIFGGRDWCHLHNSVEETKEFAEPLCIIRNPDCKTKWPEVAVFGCSPTKRPFQLPTSCARTEGKELGRKGLVILRQFGVELTPRCNRWGNQNYVVLLCIVSLVLIAGNAETETELTSSALPIGVKPQGVSARHSAVWSDYQLHLLAAEWESSGWRSEVWIVVSNLVRPLLPHMQTYIHTLSPNR